MRNVEWHRSNKALLASNDMPSCGVCFDAWVAHDLYDAVTELKRLLPG